MTPFLEPIYVTRPILPDMDSFVEELKHIWISKQLANVGYYHIELEKAIKDYLKVPNVSLFNNGTIALIVAIQSLRLQGEVITTPFTFPATPHVLTWNGITPIFCDIEEDSMNIDPNKIESLITPHTSAILAVHVYGNPCKVHDIQKIADYYGLRVIYDAAHAFGLEINGEGIGNFGDISMFSFHATKLFHTAEGGCLTYKDPNLKTRIDLLKNFGIKNPDEVIMPGINGKMNELQAALGLLVLEMVEKEIQKRKKIEEIYNNELSKIEGVKLLPNISSVSKSSYQYYVIRINEKQFGISRNTLHDKLREYNVITRKYFYPLCSSYPCYNQLPSSNPKNLPVANKVVEEVLCLPFYGDLGEDSAYKITELIRYIQKWA